MSVIKVIMFEKEAILLVIKINNKYVGYIRYLTNIIN